MFLWQNELKDDKFVYSSRPYAILNDQLQHWNAEVERFRVLTDSLQVQLLSFHVKYINMLLYSGFFKSLIPG